MRLITTTIALLLALAGCSESTQAPKAADPSSADASAGDTALTESERLTVWFDEQYEEQLQFSPVSLTFLGRKDRYGEIDDLSEEAVDAQLAWQAASVEEMKSSFDFDALTEDAKVSWELWEYGYERAKAGVPFRYNGFQFDQMNGLQSMLPTVLVNFHRIDDAGDADAWVSRASATGRAMEQNLVWAREAADRGVVTPGFALEGVIDQARKIITGVPFTTGEDSDLWADFDGELERLTESEVIDGAAADALRNAARIALVEELQPAYENLITWAEAERAKAPEVNTGIGGQENGKAFYEHRLWTQTTTRLTADEIHEIGLAEVARLRGEMDEIRLEVGFDGDLKAFFDMLRESKDDPRFYYPNTDEGRQAYIDDATAAIDRIKAELPNYFGILPKADLVVQRVEAFREQDGAAQHYYPSTPDGERPGTYYAHLSDMTAMPKRELEVIAYHEGLPGHHMQIAIAQELEGIPFFRTQTNYNAYAEGWGLYSEWLAVEMPGTYVDPYSRFGRLGSEIWRAIRLVVDTGLHAKGWTEEQALTYFLDNAAITDAQARSEVQRYIVMPGQATGYKIGMLRIQEMRRRAEAALGEDFDIRAFHDVILGGGAMPLEILDRRVDRWIEQSTAG